MRLIDADKLKKRFDETGLERMGLYPNNLVNAAPTVKAIPLTWLRKYAKKQERPYDQVVLDVITDWQKEQEEEP